MMETDNRATLSPDQKSLSPDQRMFSKNMSGAAANVAAGAKIKMEEQRRTTQSMMQMQACR